MKKDIVVNFRNASIRITVGSSMQAVNEVSNIFANGYFVYKQSDRIVYWPLHEITSIEIVDNPD